MAEVTDPKILAQLNAQEVTDPAILSQLNAGNTSMVGMPANPMTPTGSNLQRAWLGAKTGLMELPKGIGQTYGDIQESITGNRPSWAPTKEDVEYDRMRMQSYGKAGKAGEILGDLIPNVAAAAVTKGRTSSVLGQAALSALHPHESTEEQIADAVVGGLVTHAAMGVGSAVAKYTDYIRGLSGAANPGVQRFLDKGYAILPSEHSTERAVGGAQQITGKTRMENALSLHNQKILNSDVKSELGLPEDIRLSNQTLDKVIEREGNKIENIVSQPIYFRNPYYSRTGVVAEAQGYEPLEDIFRRQTIGGRDVQEASRILRNMGHQNIKGGTPGELGAATLKRQDLGKRQLALADQLEEDYGKVLGNPDVKKIWDQARKMQAKAYDVKDALDNTTGDVSFQKLNELNKGGKLTGALKDAADFYETYGNVAKGRVRANPLLGTFEGSTFGLASAMHRPEVMMLLAARPAATWIGKRAAYQNWLNAKARDEAIAAGQHIGLGTAVGINTMNNQ